MRVDLKNTFWNGKHGEVLDKLSALIPRSGKVPNPRKNQALEDWRKLQNMYYDVYNNGGCNWASKGAYAIRTLPTRYLKVAYPWSKDDVCGRYGDYLMQYQVDNLERLADAIFKAACEEQGISI
jgi:hypothetical protein